ncbi:SLAM family member 7-like isoform X3 [Salarias fasciatus]|uniref:SLAM family member 7-like isoform X3 n=1 Tax=Salarias fasciatus TaxID=181472 RepID=UPI001176A6CC|nr:SLAM family member 7-like isoform X3 [Salarias fasciatus]
MMDRRSIFFLSLVIISAAADPLKTLTASVGGNITLPNAVKEEGFLLYEGNNLALVYEKKLKIYEENHKERLHWNQNTGYFTLTRLQKNDSGIYKVDSKEGRRASVEYELIVYDAVQIPNVSILNNSSESCSLSCSVDSAQEDTTVLWSKDQEILKKNRSAASLSLTLWYWQDLDSPLHCVAENPAENKTVSVDVRTFCQLKQRGNPDSSTDSRHHLILIIIPTVCGLILLLVSVYFIWRFCHQKKSRQTEVYTEVEYADVQIRDNGHTEISRGPSESERPTLTTVYDELTFSRTDSAEHV